VSHTVPFQVIPRALVFYDLLDAAARNVADGATELLALLDDVPDGDERTERIRELEHRGDDLTHQIIARLNQTFVPPLDRHDILRLASALDDVLDHQEGVAELIELLPIEEVFPGLRSLAHVLARACDAVVRAVGDLQFISALTPDIAAIKREEREGDFVYRRAIAELYAGDFPPLEVLMWKDLLHQVETAIDRCEDVANQIESVVAKFR
jgi:predicted phosphate transport protein (TIGR00153 family)